jgi:hypothetical protein
VDLKSSSQNIELNFLNLAAKLPENTTKPNLGPRMYIANGLKEELLKGDSVIKLHKDIADSVSIFSISGLTISRLVRQFQ